MTSGRPLCLAANRDATSAIALACSHAAAAMSGAAKTTKNTRFSSQYRWRIVSSSSRNTSAATTPQIAEAE